MVMQFLYNYTWAEPYDFSLVGIELQAAEGASLSYMYIG